MPPALAAALASERETLQAFLQLLRREQRALVDGDTDGLAALGADKAPLIERLLAFDVERKRALDARGLRADRAGVQTWLDDAAGPAASLEALWRLWQALVRDAREAQRLARQNQALIEDRMLHNRRALSVLHAAAGREQVYVADGQLRALRAPRALPAA